MPERREFMDATHRLIPRQRTMYTLGQVAANLGWPREAVMELVREGLIFPEKMPRTVFKKGMADPPCISEAEMRRIKWEYGK